MAKLNLGGLRMSLILRSSPSRAFAPITRRQSTAATAVKQQYAESSAAQGSAEQQQPSLVELAATIKQETEKLDRYLKENGLAHPGSDVNSPVNFPKLPEEMMKARETVIQATKELGDLFTGPTEGIRWMALDHNNALSLQALYDYNIAKSFPLDGTASYSTIAKAVGLDEVNVRRFMRHAMTNRIFKEVSPGIVAHTIKSRVLAEDQAMADWIGFCVEDIMPAGSRVIQALRAHPEASEPTRTGFCVANDTVDQEPMFVTFGKDPVRAKRMGGAMASLTGGEGYEISYLVDNYDWQSVDSVPGGGLVVDIGGSHGFVCVDLAKRFKNMRFVVQDLPKTVASAPDVGALSDRISFQAHDFHQLQPVQGADVYLYRWIFHNHSTPYAVNMLRQLIPALKRGSRIVINDYCLLPPNTTSAPSAEEKIMRIMDLVMLTLLNAQERTEEEFRRLFAEASPGFVFKGVTRPAGCRMSIVEAVWEGEDAHAAA
ncbi:hypothetical protein BP5796_09415 [Coleophoma crateriformis]|uniref:O-methyltransferase C-terminal domain-containing protein n=1 Tax=Coleophoma crateriformis TaxID=565419 RepID=A0A3D8QXZ7_9HELO|nr:hypothetical protein BP5796_09415 [Coleophoma crateriformis]